MGLSDLYSSSYKSTDYADIKNDFCNVIKKSVDELFAKDWVTFRSELVNLYKTKPVSCYLITQQLNWGPIYELNIAGQSDFLGVPLKGRNVTMDDIPSDYKEAFSSIDGLMDAFNRLIKTDYDELGNVITIDTILRPSSPNNEFPSFILDSTFLSKDDKDLVGRHLSTINNLMDIESVIDRIKPFFDFYKNDGIRIISKFQHYLKTHGNSVTGQTTLPYNPRARLFVELAGHSQLFTRSLSLNDEGIQKKMIEKRVLEQDINKKNYENLRSNAKEYFKTLDDGNAVLDKILKNESVSINDLKINNKSLNKSQITIFNNNLANYKKANLAINELDAVNRLIDEKFGANSYNYEWVSCYTELGYVCHLFDYSILSVVDKAWNKVSQTFENLTDINEASLRDEINKSSLTNEQKTAVNSKLVECINYYNYFKLRESVSTNVLPVELTGKKITAYDKPDELFAKMKNELVSIEELFSLVKSSMIKELNGNEELISALSATTSIQYSKLSDELKDSIISEIDKKVPVRDLLKKYSLILDDSLVNPIIALKDKNELLEKQLENHKQELIANEKALNKLKENDDFYVKINNGLTQQLNGLSEQNNLLKERLGQYERKIDSMVKENKLLETKLDMFEKMEFDKDVKAFLTHFKTL